MSDAPEPYVIWSNEHHAWWAPGRMGYVHRLSEAGRYSRDTALAIAMSALPGTAARMGTLPELPIRLADAIALTAPDAAEPWR